MIFAVVFSLEIQNCIMCFPHNKTASNFVTSYAIQLQKNLNACICSLYTFCLEFECILARQYCDSCKYGILPQHGYYFGMTRENRDMFFCFHIFIKMFNMTHCPVFSIYSIYVQIAYIYMSIKILFTYIM